MSDTLDTRAVAMNEPLSDGIVKILDDGERWDSDSTQSDTIASDVSSGQYSREIACIAKEPSRVHDWLGLAAVKFSQALVATLVATHFAVARLSSNSEWTGTLDPYPILNVARAVNRRVVSVSAALVMQRSAIRASSLLAPSGAYLTWIEMCAEDPHGEKP